MIAPFGLKSAKGFSPVYSLMTTPTCPYLAADEEAGSLRQDRRVGAESRSAASRVRAERAVSKKLTVRQDVDPLEPVRREGGREEEAPVDTADLVGHGEEHQRQLDPAAEGRALRGHGGGRTIR